MVPLWVLPEHGWRHEEHDVWIPGAEVDQNVTKSLENRLNSGGDAGAPSGGSVSQEIRETSNDARVGSGAN